LAITNAQGSGTEVFNASITWDVNTATLPSGELVLGLVNPVGSSFTDLTFQLVVQGSTLVDAPFTSVSAANSYFTADLVDLAGITNDSGELQVIASIGETLTNTQHYGVYFALGDETVPCFVRGTRIRTTAGEVAVEDLRVGMSVATAAGRMAPIVWIGERRLALRGHARPHDIMPVRVAAGAFGDGVPSRELSLSPDHAVFVEGVLIPIRYLINGATVWQASVDAVQYFHIELDRHDVLFAEGLAAESYLDTGNRGAFGNAGWDHTILPCLRSRHARTRSSASPRSGFAFSASQAWPGGWSAKFSVASMSA
jgi:hypothetical protein